jgi:hypothetical protein
VLGSTSSAGSDGRAAATIQDRLVLVSVDNKGEAARAALEFVAAGGSGPSRGPTGPAASPTPH